jgi:four helix bundle protein
VTKKGIVSKHRAHEELDVYKLAKKVSVEIYAETRSFPAEERFGLVSQIRRAAVLIPVNIAEGAARRSTREFSRFLLISRGSANELGVLLEIAYETGSLSKERLAHFRESLERIFSMTSGLIRHTDKATSEERRP